MNDATYIPGHLRAAGQNRAERRKAKPPRWRPGTPRVHLNNLMRAYLKRKVADAMPDYHEVIQQNRAFKRLLVRVQQECASGDEGDLAPVLMDIRTTLEQAKEI